MEIYKEFSIEAAHSLPNVPKGHKCARLHGHSFKIRLYVEGAPNEENGWIIDYADITQAFESSRKILDHSHLNEIEGLDNPTSENLAIWVWEHTISDFPELSKIEVKETCTSGCIYQGESISFKE
jgi:6-pyruvoyltetrahydropterin/6-carboxytetrahydropterin synthase|tara:strand:- start:1420 stop:1794 length:375 start_codon:yes stop_codon:yes gene_type:complete